MNRLGENFFGGKTDPKRVFVKYTDILLMEDILQQFLAKKYRVFTWFFTVYPMGIDKEPSQFLRIIPSPL